MALVEDIATLLGEVAVGPQHTPALYSVFIKALITAKPMPSRSGSPRSTSNLRDPFVDMRDSNTPREPVFTMNNLDPPHDSPSSANPSELEGVFLRPEFQLNGEMGPVADISTFPPTMMAQKTLDGASPNMLSMDSILSANFWDNILIPGLSSS